MREMPQEMWGSQSIWSNFGEKLDSGCSVTLITVKECEVDEQ